MITNSGNMHITNGNQIHSVANAYMNTENMSHKAKTPQKGNEINDEIILSNVGQEFSGYLNKLSAEPEVRKNVVNKYQDLINKGSYKIDANEIAEKILDGTLL